jgi:ketosteroid isomerase-like protein
MSQQNVENLRAFFQTWDPWEWARGEGMSLFDPALVYEGDFLPDHVGESYRGYDGLARATRQWLEPIEEVTVELERITGTGDDLVSVQQASGTMRHTGIHFDQVYTWLWRFRGGKVTYLKTFGDTQAALKAAGLAE